MTEFMVVAMKSFAQQRFGRAAADYATSEVHAKGASLKRLVELTEPKSHWRVLDVATGAGHTALAFAPHVAKVTATDITEEMLREARKLAASRGLTNVRTLHAKAEDLPFPDASFDLVGCPRRASFRRHEGLRRRGLPRADAWRHDRHRRHHRA